MGCCGSSSTSAGPSHMSYAAVPAGGATSPSVSAPWRVTFPDGTTAWFASQLIAYAEAGVNGGSVDYLPAGAGGVGAGVST